MKATLLINTDAAIATKTLKNFTVDQGKTVQLFQRGLAGAEAIVIELLGSDEDPDGASVPVDAKWIATQSLSDFQKTAVLSAPGNYRLHIETSAGAVVAGVYGD